MTSAHRRRIDRVRSPEFTADLEKLPLEEIRARCRICADLDVEYSYYRRLLQGRLDLLTFEMRRRAGEETRSVVEALPEILSAMTAREPGLAWRRVPVQIPDLPEEGRRAVDRALADAVLAHLPDMGGEELASARERLAEVEAEVSQHRRSVFEAFDLLQAELVRRYRAGEAVGDDPPQG